jgi:hypothetical protein
MIGVGETHRRYCSQLQAICKPLARHRAVPWNPTILVLDLAIQTSSLMPEIF